MFYLTDSARVSLTTLLCAVPVRAAWEKHSFGDVSLRRRRIGCAEGLGSILQIPRLLSAAARTDVGIRANVLSLVVRLL